MQRLEHLRVASKYRKIRAVQLEKVHVISGEPLKAPLHRPAKHHRRKIGWLAERDHSSLGGNHYVVAASTKNPTDQSLAMTITICACSIVKGDAKLEGTPERCLGDCVVSSAVRSVPGRATAYSPGAEPNL